MSLHSWRPLLYVQDHYENMYAVICGIKTFWLLLPSDAHRLGIKPFPVAQYERGPDGKLHLRLQEPEKVRPLPCACHLSI